MFKKKAALQTWTACRAEMDGKMEEDAAQTEDFDRETCESVPLFLFLLSFLPQEKLNFCHSSLLSLSSRNPPAVAVPQPCPHLPSSRTAKEGEISVSQYLRSCLTDNSGDGPLTNRSDLCSRKRLRSRRGQQVEQYRKDFKSRKTQLLNVSFWFSIFLQL